MLHSQARLLAGLPGQEGPETTLTVRQWCSLTQAGSYYYGFSGWARLLGTQARDRKN